MFELRAQLIPPLFFMEHHFYLKEWLADKLWLFRLRCLGAIFLEINKMSLFVQGKQVMVFVTNDKNTKFQLKI